MRIALPLAIVTFVAGVVIGVCVVRQRLGEPDPGPLAAAQARAAGATADSGGGIKEKLQRLRDETGDLRNRLAAAGKPVLPAEEARMKAAELRKKIPALLESHNGKALIALMRELASLGEPGYDGAMEIAAILRNDLYGPNDDGKDATKLLGIDDDTYWKAFSGRMVPLLAWSVTHPERAPAWLRSQALGRLTWNGDYDAPSFFAETLRGEKDPEFAKNLAEYLGHYVIGTPDSPALLVECARVYRDNVEVLSNLVTALGKAGTTESVQAIEELMGHPNAKIREAAGFEMSAIRPPVAGAFIDNPWSPNPGQPSTFQRGDIVVSRNGEPVTSWMEFRTSLHNAPREGTTTLVVHRGSDLVTIEVKGPLWYPYGKYVAPGR